MQGILAILTSQVKQLATDQGIDPMRLDIASHMDQTLDYRENRSNLVRQFGLTEKPVDTHVSKAEIEEFEASYKAYKETPNDWGLLRSIKPVRLHKTPNPTFKRFNASLWRIKARYVSTCVVCKGSIDIGEEISLFEGAHGWAHVSHAEA